MKVYKRVFYPQKGIHQRTNKNTFWRQRPVWFPKGKMATTPVLGLQYTGKQRLNFPRPKNQQENRDKTEPGGTWQGSETDQLTLLLGLTLWEWDWNIRSSGCGSGSCSLSSLQLRWALCRSLLFLFLGAMSWAHWHCLSAPNHKTCSSEEREKEPPVAERAWSARLTQHLHISPSSPGFLLPAAGCWHNTRAMMWVVQN